MKGTDLRAAVTSRWSDRLLRRRWRIREAQHHRESSRRDNERLRESYTRHPVRLVGVVTADLFLGDDIRRLAAHLRPILREDRFDFGGGMEVEEFLRDARSAVGGGRATLAPRRFVHEGQARGLFGTDIPMRLPAAISSAQLLLSQLPSALVVGAVVAEFRDDPVARIFAANHEGFIERRRHSIAFGMTEEAKRVALAQAIAPAAATGLLPDGLGLLRARRYPRGALVILSIPAMPADDVSWRDVARVLGLETWNRWDGANRRLLVGVPDADQSRVFDGEGLSLLLVTATDNAQDIRELFRLPDELRDWLPWVTVMQCAFQVTQEAAVLRKDLDSVRLGGRGLDALVARLHERQYQLSRMRHAASDVGTGRSIGFPDLVRHVPRVQPTPATAPGEAAAPDAPKAPASDVARSPNRDTLREGVIRAIGHDLDEGFEEVELSLQRARMLAELSTDRVIRIWTRVVAGLTIVLCILTAVLVYQAFSSHR